MQLLELNPLWIAVYSFGDGAVKADSRDGVEFSEGLSWPSGCVSVAVMSWQALLRHEMVPAIVTVCWWSERFPRADAVLKWAA